MELRQPKVVLKVSQIPDWGRRAIRLSLALTFFTTIAITLWPVPGTVGDTSTPTPALVHMQSCAAATL